MNIRSTGGVAPVSHTPTSLGLSAGNPPCQTFDTLSSAALDEGHALHGHRAADRYTAALEARLADLEARLAALETSSAPPDPSALLDYDGAATRLRIGVRTLRKLVTEGEIRPVRIRGRVLFSPAALDAFARACAGGVVTAPKGRPGARKTVVGRDTR